MSRSTGEPEIDVNPDGLAFDNNGLIWIQTDGNYSNKDGFAGQGNNQMLVSDPATGEIRRFNNEPQGVQGDWMRLERGPEDALLGIQHPSEKGDSCFLDSGSTTPRSAIVAITRDDGATIG